MRWGPCETTVAVTKDFVMFWIGTNVNDEDPSIMYSIVRVHEDQGDVIIKMSEFPFGVLATLRITTSNVAILIHDNDPKCMWVYKKF